MNKHIQLKLIAFITLFINFSGILNASEYFLNRIPSQAEAFMQIRSPQSHKHLATALSERRTEVDYTLKILKALNDLESPADIPNTLAYEDDTIWVPLFIQFLQQKELTKVCKYREKIEIFSTALLEQLPEQEFRVELSEITELKKMLMNFIPYKNVEELVSVLNTRSGQLEELGNKNAQEMQQAEDVRAIRQAQQEQKERELIEVQNRYLLNYDELLQSTADAVALKKAKTREQKKTKKASVLKEEAREDTMSS